MQSQTPVGQRRTRAPSRRLRALCRPHPQNPRQPRSKLRVCHGLLWEPQRGPGGEPLMTGRDGGGMVNGLKKARRENRVNVLLNK
ncbi:hypothetical protein [Citrobacter sp. wls619]|uniref:hypothetical protein n=1 Tax=Citrobacter sp. wls619 TaxID=2576432 RepID=UPI001484D78C|nr:hypothetical protein [Citrobacter sp. wls619]